MVRRICCSSLVSNTPLAAYINIIRDDNNASVGIATGIQGIVNLLIALPVGALSDRIGRERLGVLLDRLGVLADLVRRGASLLGLHHALGGLELLPGPSVVRVGPERPRKVVHRP